MLQVICEYRAEITKSLIKTKLHALSLMKSEIKKSGIEIVKFIVP